MIDLIVHNYVVGLNKTLVWEDIATPFLINFTI